jgi:hypothetical protein
MDLESLSASDLLAQYVAIMNELRRREILRSSNNPVADYAELLVSRALGLELVTKSTAGYDAVAPDGTRYEIKGRRPTTHNRSRQLSAIRNLDSDHFHFLAGVLFNEDFSVARACLVPLAVVKEKAAYRAHTRASILHLNDSLWLHSDVRDIMAEVQGAAAML